MFRFNLWQWFWGRIWWLSETTRIPLGEYAPWVFHQMIGCDHQVKEIK